MRFPKIKDYPTQIYFANEVYTIIFKEKFRYYGETSFNKKTITIKAGMSERATLTTFIHELIHMIEMEEPIKIKHKHVYKWEKAIMELLIDNFLSAK